MPIAKETDKKRERAAAMAGGVHDLAEKLGGISLTSSPSTSAHISPGSAFAVRRADHSRRSHPPAETGTSPPALDDDEKAGGLLMVRRKKDFRCMERVNGRMLNVLQGLELHAGVFSTAEQRRIVDCVHNLQEDGRKGRLRDHTYSEPRKWMRGKGRVTLQFGCCYNYAVDKNGNPPGIIRDEEVDIIPPLLKAMIRRMVAWEVLPPSCIPNSCIVNIYDKDDCIPPHIDHHDFVRPFCTVSFLSECNIIFGTELKIIGPGEFSGSTKIPLPVGSVLVLNGNGADIAKHCVPAVPAKRISITFRRMDDSKLPYGYEPDPELQNIRPIRIKPIVSPALQGQVNSSPTQQQYVESTTSSTQVQTQVRHRIQSSVYGKAQSAVEEASAKSFQLGEDDFPPLGSGPTNSRKSTRPLRQ